MTVNQREMLSALVDGQLEKNELDVVLQQINEDASTRSEFLDLQYASDLLHGYTRGISARPFDLTQRISDALADEPVYQQKSTALMKAKVIQIPKTFWKQATGLAMAASVGALAVVGVMNITTEQQTELAMQNAMPAATQVASQVNRWTVGEPEVEDRLNNYLVDHNEYAGGTGMFSYGRVVSYGTEQ